jgi:hypothetical protein
VADIFLPTARAVKMLRDWAAELGAPAPRPRRVRRLGIALPRMAAVR